MDLRELGCEDGMWMELAQDRVQWQALVLNIHKSYSSYTILNIWSPKALDRGGDRLQGSSYQLIQWVSGAFSLGVKRLGASSDEVKNARRHTSIALYVFMARRLIKHRENFAFTLQVTTKITRITLHHDTELSRAVAKLSLTYVKTVLTN